MREVRLQLFHNDCPWCSATENHPEATIKEVSWGGILVGNKRVLCHGIYEITGPTDAVFDCNKKIEDSKVRLEVIERNADRTLVFSRWLHKSSPLAAIQTAGCVSIENVIMAHGVEQYHVVGESADKLGAAVDALKRMGYVKIQRIGDYAAAVTDDALTRKQKDAFDLAVAYGYYSWPRRVTLEELAKTSGISRKVYQDHLRKAESKLMLKLKGNGGGI